MSYGITGVGSSSGQTNGGFAKQFEQAPTNTLPQLVQPFAPMADGPGLSVRVTQLEAVIVKQSQAIAELADAICQLRGVIGV